MLESFEQLVAFQNMLRSKRIDRARFAAPDYEKLRFRLGASLAETRVPYTLALELTTVLDAAANSLLVACLMRHRMALSPADLDLVLLDPAALMVDGMRPESWYLGDVPQGSIFHRIFTRSMQQNRYLDAGLLFWWFGNDVPGRRLLNDLKRYVQKLGDEERERGQGEETLRLGLLALCYHWTGFHSAISEKAVNPLVRQAYNATAVVLYETLAAVVEEYFRPSGVTEHKVGALEAAAYQALTLPISPLLIGTKEHRFGLESVSPFGISDASLRILERFFPALTDRSTPVDEAAKQIATKLASDKDATEATLKDVRRNRLHHALLDMLWSLKPGEANSPEQKVLAELNRIRQDDGLFLQRMQEKKELKEWLENWKRLGSASIQGKMDGFAELVQSLAKLAPGFLSDKAALEAAYSEQAQRFVIQRHVEALNAAVLQQSKIIVVATGDTKADYELGRLYRFAIDDKAPLMTNVSYQEGHFFIDLKDFTKRTFATKEVAMADFMRSEFYEPILRTAKEYQVGMAHIDRSGISINNLLGDAVSASGDMVSLMSFSRDLFAIIETYRDKLKGMLPQSLLAERLGALDDNYKARRKELLTERSTLVSAINTLTAQYKGLETADPKRPAIGSQLRNHQEAFAALESQIREAGTVYHDARGLIEGSGLEAGAFLSYGAAAETIQFNDDVFGPLKVAIGEKINESARGTARDPGVRTQLEHFLQRKRNEMRDESVTYPFQTYVDESIHLVLEPDLEGQLKTALVKKDPDMAKRLIQSISQRLTSDIALHIRKEAPDYRSLTLGNGIYNVGLAMSGEAVEAYVAAMETKRTVRRREIQVADLHEELRRRFAFPRASYGLILISAEAPDGPPEMMINLGSMVFKGFERREPQTIYEHLSPRSAFYQAFLKHHVRDWLTQVAN
jgi:hypothetical protein